jgi:GPI-anchor transamidase subunit S
MTTTQLDNGMETSTPTPSTASEQVTVASVGKVLPATTVARKEPPPEKPSDIRRRSWVTLSFWLIVLLGVPIWWHTTSIHRAQLPLAEMLGWADGKVGISRLYVRVTSADLLSRRVAPFSHFE